MLGQTFSKATPVIHVEVEVAARMQRSRNGFGYRRQVGLIGHMIQRIEFAQHQVDWFGEAKAAHVRVDDAQRQARAASLGPRLAAHDRREIDAEHLDLLLAASSSAVVPVPQAMSQADFTRGNTGPRMHSRAAPAGTAKDAKKRS